AGQVMSQSPAAGTMIAVGTAVDLVVSSGQPAGSPQMDANVSVDGSGQVTTTPFSTSAAGELLVAFVSSDGPATGVQMSSVTGAGLTWPLSRRAVTEVGDAEVWTATAPTTLSNVAVSATQTNTTNGPYHQSLTVVSFTNAAIGSTTSGSGSRNPPSLLISGTVSGSLVFAVGFDADQPTPRTLPAGPGVVPPVVGHTPELHVACPAFQRSLFGRPLRGVGFPAPDPLPVKQGRAGGRPAGGCQEGGEPPPRRNPRRFAGRRVPLVFACLSPPAGRRGPAPADLL